MASQAVRPTLMSPPLAPGVDARDRFRCAAYDFSGVAEQQNAAQRRYLQQQTVATNDLTSSPRVGGGYAGGTTSQCMSPGTAAPAASYTAAEQPVVLRHRRVGKVSAVGDTAGFVDQQNMSTGSYATLQIDPAIGTCAMATVGNAGWHNELSKRAQPVYRQAVIDPTYSPPFIVPSSASPSQLERPAIPADVSLERSSRGTASQAPLIFPVRGRDVSPAHLPVYSGYAAAAGSSATFGTAPQEILAGATVTGTVTTGASSSTITRPPIRITLEEYNRLKLQEQATATGSNYVAGGGVQAIVGGPQVVPAAKRGSPYMLPDTMQVASVSQYVAGASGPQAVPATTASVSRTIVSAAASAAATGGQSIAAATVSMLGRRSPIAPEHAIPATYKVNGNTVVFTLGGNVSQTVVTGSGLEAAPTMPRTPTGGQVSGCSHIVNSTTAARVGDTGNMGDFSVIKDASSAAVVASVTRQCHTCSSPTAVPELGASSQQPGPSNWREEPLAPYECVAFSGVLGDDPVAKELSQLSSAEPQPHTPDHLRSIWLMTRRDLAVVGFDQRVVPCPYRSLQLAMKHVFVESEVPNPRRVNVVVMHGPHQATMAVPSSSATGARALIHMQLDVVSVLKILVTDSKGAPLGCLSVDIPKLICDRVVKCRDRISITLEGQEGATLQAAVTIELSSEPAPTNGVRLTQPVVPFASVLEEKQNNLPPARKYDQVSLKFGGIRVLQQNAEAARIKSVRVSVMSCSEEIVAVPVPVIPISDENPARSEGPDVKVSLSKAMEDLQFVARADCGKLLGAGAFNVNSLLESRKSRFQGELPLEGEDEDDIVGQLCAQISLQQTLSASATDGELSPGYCSRLKSDLDEPRSTATPNLKGLRGFTEVSEEAFRGPIWSAMSHMLKDQVPQGLARLRMRKVVVEIPKAQAKKQMCQVIQSIPQARARKAMAPVLTDICRSQFKRAHTQVMEDIKSSQYRRAYAKLLKGLAPQAEAVLQEGAAKRQGRELRRAQTSPTAVAKLEERDGEDDATEGCGRGNGRTSPSPSLDSAEACMQRPELDASASQSADEVSPRGDKDEIQLGREAVECASPDLSGSALEEETNVASEETRQAEQILSGQEVSSQTQEAVESPEVDSTAVSKNDGMMASASVRTSVDSEIKSGEESHQVVESFETLPSGTEEVVHECQSSIEISQHHHSASGMVTEESRPSVIGGAAQQLTATDQYQAARETVAGLIRGSDA